MSRLCRLKNKTHGEDGQWAYKMITTLQALLAEKDAEIEKLQDKLTYLNLEPCSHCHLPAEVMSLATAVIDFRNQMRVQALEHKLLPAEYDTMCEIALAIKEETK